MRWTLWLVAVGGTGLIAGCGSTPTTRPNTTPYQVTRIPPGSSGVSGSSAAPPARPSARDEAPAPRPVLTRQAVSLDQERQAQAERSAAALAKKTGVALEKVEGTGAPTWWPGGAAGGKGYGRGRGATLELAYQQASRQAAGADRAAAVSRGAYTGMSMGDYIAWLEMKGVLDATPPAPAAAPPKPTPAESPAPLPGSDIPAWFTAKATEANGRVTVGAMADAPSVREAPRMASEAGRAALAQIMGVEPGEVRLESTYVKKQGEGYRAFVLVSCAGTIKK